MANLIETIAEAAGFEAAATMCHIWGGRTLYIPDNPPPHHPIAEDVGYEELLAIVAIYGGQTIHPPKLHKSHLAHRAKARCLKAHNVSERQIAWVLDLTPNRVARLLEGCNMNHESYLYQQETEALESTSD